jgi:prolyl oligopeptidase
MAWRVPILFSGLVALMAGSVMAGEPDDPLLWLEDVTGDRALSWVRERNAESTAELTKSAGFAALEKRLLAILDSDAKIPAVTKMGPHYYNFWKDARHQRGLWRRTTLEEYRKPEPAWEVVLDLDALAETEKVNWVWHGATPLSPAYEICIVELSRGGADADVKREFDLKAKTFIEGGYTLPEAKGDIAWRDRDSVFVSTDFGPGSLTSSGYPRVVKQWSRKTPLDRAETVFECKPEEMRAFAFRDLTPGFGRDFVGRSLTFFTNELYLRRDGKLIKIEKPDDATASVDRELLLVTLRTDWAVGGKTYAAGSLIATDFEGFLKGDREFDVLFEPSERKSLGGFSPTRHHILLNELDNIRSRIYILTHLEGRWDRQPLPGVPELGTSGASAVDPDESDDYWFRTTDFLTPNTLAIGTVGGAPPERLKQDPAFFNASGLAVSQHEATSADGTRIPYFQVARADLPLDGSTPTLLTGYGGFQLSRVPAYGGGVGAAWLESGGVYVLANLRGGGEFGPKWHKAALKANRPRVYEDFAAVTEDLIRRKVTSPPHLGIQGGSNGGLLVGNMLTRRPELFGAVVCQVPLLDMRRYHTLLAGASWMGEYGNPDLPEEWEFIRGFSPYHNLKEGAKYPRTLFTTSTRDDRVHPGHARKMAARMKGMGSDLLYYENIEGGHGGAADNKQAAFMSALAYSFLRQQLK